MVLLARWSPPDDLLLQCMRLDYANHPDARRAWTRWIEAGACPYADATWQPVCGVSRSARRSLWDWAMVRRPAWSALELAAAGLDAGALAGGGRGTPTPQIERVPYRACLICTTPTIQSPRNQ
jgi:hypothetical protein